MASTLFSFKFEMSTMVFTIRIHEWIVEKCSVILKIIWTIASRLPLNNIQIEQKHLLLIQTIQPNSHIHQCKLFRFPMFQQFQLIMRLVWSEYFIAFHWADHKLRCCMPAPSSSPSPLPSPTLPFYRFYDYFRFQYDLILRKRHILHFQNESLNAP